MTVLGILGGGQLGRMTALAAAEMGIRCVIYDPDQHCCAAQICDQIVGDFTDLERLRTFAEHVDAITLEFENIPADTVRFLETLRPMNPSATLLEICQDRLLEKQWLQNLGLGVAPFQDIADQETLIQALNVTEKPQFLKTRRFGYDGKGQIQLTSTSCAESAWKSLNGTPCILEERVDFACEVSLIVARNRNGDYCHLPLVQNMHENLPGGGKILRTTLAPADVSSDIARNAYAMGRVVAEAAQLVGVLALEMFLCRDGSLLINEMAPRPHNSGHWSIEGAAVSQFDLLVRAVCDLPLPETIPVRKSRMENLLGFEAETLSELLKTGGHVHVYGKGTAKAGRKMGHITHITPIG